MRLTDLRVIHAGLSPRLANVVVDVLRKERERDDVTHPAHAHAPDERQMLDELHDYLVGELANVPAIVEVPAPEPAAKRVARKMAKAGAKAAKAA